MEFYLTSKRTGARLRIPLLPDRLNVKTGASVVSMSIIKKGEVKIPRGSTLTGYSWNGVFPSDQLASASYVYDWQEPAKIIKLLEEWQENGDTITLMVTDLSINVDTFIESFVYEYYGAGNVSYTINLTKRLELFVTTTPAPVVPPSSASSSDESGGNKKYGTVTGGKVNVRKGPGTNYKSYGTLSKGTQVEILDKSGNWYKIVYPKGEGGVGWISASYIKLTTSSSSSSSGSSSNSSSKKNSSSSTAKSTTSNNTNTKKSLTLSKPNTSLINVAKDAVKKSIESKTKVVSSALSKVTNAIKSALAGAAKSTKKKTTAKINTPTKKISPAKKNTFNKLKK